MLRFLHALILIGYTMTQSPCNNIRDNNQNCIVEGCQIWFDGCQTCAILPSAVEINAPRQVQGRERF